MVKHYGAPDRVDPKRLSPKYNGPVTEQLDQFAALSLKASAGAPKSDGLPSTAAFFNNKRRVRGTPAAAVKGPPNAHPQEVYGPDSTSAFGLASVHESQEYFKAGSSSEAQEPLERKLFSEPKGSLVQLLDGTDAMVRCMRKGNGALECPVCLQLFNNPVVPVDSECRCGLHACCLFVRLLFIP